MPPNNQPYSPGPAPFTNYVTPEVIAQPGNGKLKKTIIVAVLFLLVLIAGLSTYAILTQPSDDELRQQNLAVIATELAAIREDKGYIPFEAEAYVLWDAIDSSVIDPSTQTKYELVLPKSESVELGQFSYTKTADFDFEICTRLESTSELYCLTNPNLTPATQ